MRMAFITRATLHTVPGGDTVQTEQTAAQLRTMGVQADILLTGNKIDYSRYDLFHFMNITRPADLLVHARKCGKQFVITPILVDYSEYDRLFRKGLSGWLLRPFSPPAIEYIKTMARWLTGKDKLVSKQYMLKGQRKSIAEILNRAGHILPNSSSEYEALNKLYSGTRPHTIVPNGIDKKLFMPGTPASRNTKLVICAARIEGIKNQLNLIRALNGTDFTLLLIGNAAPNQQAYYNECKRIAGSNIQFINHMPQQELRRYYQQAAVHVLPSWFETCGLSSLEAAAMGCNIVITAKGYTRDYFGDDAFYCDPADPASILASVRQAAAATHSESLANKIQRDYTWEKAASITLDVYNKILNR